MLTTPLPSDGLHQVVDVEHRLAEEAVAALLLDLQQAALDRADRGRRDVAVFGPELRGVVADELQHRAQVLEVEQQQAVVVGDLEDQRQHAFLRLVEVRAAAPAAAAPCRRSWRAPGGPARRTRPRASPDSRPTAARAVRSFVQPRLELVARACPGLAMPVRSPLTSAMKTGTPMREKCSASTCRVMVLPVPVAPVMQPWRLASAGSRAMSVSPALAMTRGSVMVVLESGVGRTSRAAKREISVPTAAARR